MNFKGSRKMFRPESAYMEVYPFIVPLLESKEKLTINWKLIEGIQTYISHKLLDIVYMVKPHKVIRANFNVDKAYTIPRPISAYGNTSCFGIWDDKFTGVRYVKLSEFSSAVKWELPTLHLERRSGNSLMNDSNTTKHVIVDNFET